MRCFYDEGYFLPLPPGHPFPMEKFPEAHALVRDHVQVESPPPLAREDLERVHAPGYLDAVSYDSSPERPTGLKPEARNRLGLPADPQLLARSTLETAGTVGATLAALEDGIAANLAGGTHHAFPDRGLGFCVLNDIAVAIEYLRARGTRPRCLVVDTDAHQGNGTHAIFRGDDEVFTYSIHVGRNYPALKEPGDCDVPLERFVESEPYLSALGESLPPVFSQSAPDLVFWISGADIHHADRFGQMKLTTSAIGERDRLVLHLCQDFGVPTVVVYGGGYNRQHGKTAALHAQSILLAADVFAQKQRRKRRRA